MDEIRTQRLVLRRWTMEDRAPFAAMNADRRVMEHFPSALTREASDLMVDRFEAGLERDGYGMWALEHNGDFIGFTGLAPIPFEAHFTPAVEVGWRLATTAWGRGFATEAATAAVRFAFETLYLDELVSMTIPRNHRSIAVMERLGMTRDAADDFDHPRLPVGDPIRRHVLYRSSASNWRAAIPGL